MSLNVILACTENLGIGIEGRLPWESKEELSLFRNKTKDSVLIMGRKTVENLPKLKNRIIICVSTMQAKIGTDRNNSKIVPTLEQAINTAKQDYPEKNIFIAGGGLIYNECFSRFSHLVDKLYISFMAGSYPCDTFVNINLGDWVTRSEVFYQDFTHRTMIYSPCGENQYLKLLVDTLDSGIVRKGRNGETKSLFGKNFSFDLTKGFPLLTTKKMFFKGIVEELLFFIKGNTNTKSLEAKGVNIWKGNTSRKFLDSIGKVERPEGLMGPMYGYQWRFFGAQYDEKTGLPLDIGTDQLKYVIDTILTDPASRRIIMTDFNPNQAYDGVLFPCHSIVIQFYVTDNHLDMLCYNRSQDLLLGVPFNIASSALLLTLIAKVTGLKPRNLHISMGDVHIYQNHYEAVKKQISRWPYSFPILSVDSTLTEVSTTEYKIKILESLSFTDFHLVDYISHPAIKADMVA